MGVRASEMCPPSEGALPSRAASGATALGATPSAGGDFGEQLRVAGALQQIGTLIQQHQRFFRHPGAVFLDDVPC